MKPFKDILVPIDFSPCSAEAMRVAAGLAADQTASVCLLHVTEPINYALPTEYPFGLPSPLDMLDKAEIWLADAKKGAEAMGIRRVTTRHLEGSPALEIVDYAKKNAFDLIVIGTHGRSGLGHMLLGSVAERVVRTAPCPVLTVHADPQQAAKPADEKAQVA